MINSIYVIASYYAGQEIWAPDLLKNTLKKLLKRTGIYTRVI
jgi:hypothetical protein